VKGWQSLSRFLVKNCIHFKVIVSLLFEFFTFILYFQDQI